MSEYRDIHNNVYKVIQRTPSVDEETRKEKEEMILDSLFAIFMPANTKKTAAVLAS